MKPTSNYYLSVPLCRLNCLPWVRPILEVVVQLLVNKFMIGYREDDKVLYGSLMNMGKVEEVTKKTYEAWDENL